MIVKAGLLLDLGNSETRVMLLAGNNAYRFNLSNKFAELPAGYRVPNRYNNDKNTIFQYKGSYYANGAIVEREFNGSELRPSALQSKSDQLVTDLTLSMAIIKSAMVLAKAHNVTVDNLDLTFNISLLMPPIDHESNEQKMIDRIRTLDKVSVLIPQNFSLDIKIGDVRVFPEAVAAFFGAFFTEVGAKPNPHNEGKSLENGDFLIRDNGSHLTVAEVEANKPFSTGYTLVMDIGAGTTDVALFKDMELVEMSKETFKRGGNTVQSIVLAEIKKKYGYTPDNIAAIVKTGWLEEGNTRHDVSDIVTMAKEVYSKQTRADIVSYLERLTIDLQVVKGLLVAGGGSLPSVRRFDDHGNELQDGQVSGGTNHTEKIVSPAMADVLVKFLHELAPRIEVMNTEGKDLRTLNIEGLLLLHKYLE